jgi:hypothetical protein
MSEWPYEVAPRDPEVEKLLAPKGNLHKHKCEKCGRVWAHENGGEDHMAAHTCSCGEKQFWIYLGDEEVTPPQKEVTCAT